MILDRTTLEEDLKKLEASSEQQKLSLYFTLGQIAYIHARLSNDDKSEAEYELQHPPIPPV